jgi:hypothetical protein
MSQQESSFKVEAQDIVFEKESRGFPKLSGFEVGKEVIKVHGKKVGMAISPLALEIDR